MKYIFFITKIPKKRKDPLNKKMVKVVELLICKDVLSKRHT